MAPSRQLEDGVRPALIPYISEPPSSRFPHSYRKTEKDTLSVQDGPYATLARRTEQANKLNPDYLMPTSYISTQSEVSLYALDVQSKSAISPPSNTNKKTHPASVKKSAPELQQRDLSYLYDWSKYPGGFPPPPPTIYYMPVEQMHHPIEPEDHIPSSSFRHAHDSVQILRAKSKNGAIQTALSNSNRKKDNIPSSSWMAASSNYSRRAEVDVVIIDLNDLHESKSLESLHSTLLNARVDDDGTYHSAGPSSLRRKKAITAARPQVGPVPDTVTTVPSIALVDKSVSQSVSQLHNASPEESPHRNELPLPTRTEDGDTPHPARGAFRHSVCESEHGYASEETQYGNDSEYEYNIDSKVFDEPGQDGKRGSGYIVVKAGPNGEMPAISNKDTLVLYVRRYLGEEKEEYSHFIAGKQCEIKYDAGCGEFYYAVQFEDANGRTKTEDFFPMKGEVEWRVYVRGQPGGKVMSAKPKLRMFKGTQGKY